jgi:hypothetical protein
MVARHFWVFLLPGDLHGQCSAQIRIVAYTRIDDGVRWCRILGANFLPSGDPEQRVVVVVRCSRFSWARNQSAPVGPRLDGLW